MIGKLDLTLKYVIVMGGLTVCEPNQVYQCGEKLKNSFIYR